MKNKKYSMKGQTYSLFCLLDFLFPLWLYLKEGAIQGIN
jgi:hypothetical protein